MESMNTNNLSTFKTLVLKDAHEKRDKLMSKVKKKHDKIIRAKEDEFVAEAETEMKKSVSKATKESNEKILYTQIESKKKLLLKRESIINEVMGEVNQKLRAFTQSEEYGEYLAEAAKKAIFELGEGEKVIYIASTDLQYKEMLENIENSGMPVRVEAALQKDFIGGVKIYNPDRQISVDYSFGELLSEEKGSFLQRSGLTVE